MRLFDVRAPIATMVVLIMSACGGSVVPAGGGGDSAAAEGNDQPEVVPVTCPDEMAELVETLEDLDSRLSVGLNFQAYGERVGDIRAAYDRIDTDELGAGCIEHVGVAAEDAMNAYVRAYNIWNECIGDIDCDNDSITPDLQGEWADATDLIEQARDGLDR